jgi:soluble lytic murein transglycosylase-like protein
MRLREFTKDTVANWKTIADRNSLDNPDLILPGQVLDVGDGIVLPKGTTYVVKPGDTLSKIAKNIQQGKIPSDGSTTTVTPKPPVSSSRPDYHDPSYDAPKVSTAPPVINLPNVDPPEIKRGHPTMKDDPRLKSTTPPVVKKTAPTRPDYHDPAYDAPPDASVDDAELKRRIGADQPIPSYKMDPSKDKAMLDKLEKQDRERQKQLQKQPGGIQGVPKKSAPKTSSGTKTSSSEFDRIRDIESSNRDYDSAGRPVTSSKGAKFAAQVMPATNTDPGYGVTPAKDSSAGESNRVGRDYFNALKTKYGHPELAAAAYNAGPGRIDKILQKAQETGQHWKDLLPAETKNYLAKLKSKTQVAQD